MIDRKKSITVKMINSEALSIVCLIDFCIKEKLLFLAYCVLDENNPWEKQSV